MILASQRIEDIMGWDLPSDTTKRGSLPSVVEYCILAYVAGNNYIIQSEESQYDVIFDPTDHQQPGKFVKSKIMIAALTVLPWSFVK